MRNAPSGAALPMSLGVLGCDVENSALRDGAAEPRTPKRDMETNVDAEKGLERGFASKDSDNALRWQQALDQRLRDFAIVLMVEGADKLKRQIFDVEFNFLAKFRDDRAHSALSWSKAP